MKSRTPKTDKIECRHNQDLFYSGTPENSNSILLSQYKELLELCASLEKEVTFLKQQQENDYFPLA